MGPADNICLVKKLDDVSLVTIFWCLFCITVPVHICSYNSIIWAPSIQKIVGAQNIFCIVGNDNNNMKYGFILFWTNSWHFGVQNRWHVERNNMTTDISGNSILCWGRSLRVECTFARRYRNGGVFVSRWREQQLCQFVDSWSLQRRPHICRSWLGYGGNSNLMDFYFRNKD